MFLSDIKRIPIVLPEGTTIDDFLKNVPDVFNPNREIISLEDNKVYNIVKDDITGDITTKLASTLSGVDGGSGAGLLLDKREYTGDGETTIYDVVFSESNINVYVNGILQTKDKDYTIGVNKIEFTSAPNDGDEIALEGYYFINMTELGIPATVITGTYTANGGETSISINNEAKIKTGIVTVNGIDRSNDVTITDTSIEFNNELEANDVVNYYLFSSFKVIDIDAIMPLVDPAVLDSYGDVVQGDNLTLTITNFDQFATYTITADYGVINFNGEKTFTYTAPDNINEDFTDKLTIKVEKEGYRPNIKTYDINVKNLAFNTDQQLNNTDFNSNAAYVENLNL